MTDRSVARLSARSQTVIPKPIRERLGIGPGDLVVFEEKNGEIVLSRLPKSDMDDPFAVFSEWASEADERAYADLWALDRRQRSVPLCRACRP